MLNLQQIESIYKVKDGMEVKGRGYKRAKWASIEARDDLIIKLRKTGMYCKAIGEVVHLSEARVSIIVKKFTEGASKHINSVGV